MLRKYVDKELLIDIIRIDISITDKQHLIDIIEGMPVLMSVCRPKLNGKRVETDNK